MQREKKFRVLEKVDGYDLVFNQMYFKKMADNYVAENKQQNGKFAKSRFYSELAEETCLSDESIKQWYFGNSGPGDISIVKKIAVFFDTDYRNFLVQTEREEAGMNDFLTSNTSDVNETISTLYSMIMVQNEMRISIITGGPIFGHENVIDPNKRWDLLREHMNAMRGYVDCQALVLDESMYTAMQQILLEVEADQGYGCAMSWEQINPDYPMARILFLREDQESEFETLKEREELIMKYALNYYPNYNDAMIDYIDEEYIFRREFTKTITKVFKERLVR